MSTEGALHRRHLGAVRGFFSRSDSWRDCQTAAVTALLLACGALLLVDIRGVQVSPIVSQVAKGLQPRTTVSTASRIVRLHLVDFLNQSCSDVAEEHEELVTTYLRPWSGFGLSSNNTDSWPTGRLYLSNDSIYLHPDLEEERLVPTYLSQLQVPKVLEIPDVRVAIVFGVVPFPFVQEVTAAPTLSSIEQQACKDTGPSLANVLKIRDTPS